MRAGAANKFDEGMLFYRKYTPLDNARARELLEEAIRLDPEFARAYAGLAATHRRDWIFGWQDLETSAELAHRTAQKAVELARREPEPKPSLPNTLEQLAYVLLYRRQYQDAIYAAEEAVRRDPNFTNGYAVWAHALIYWGKPEEALRKMQEAIAHNPEYPFFYDYYRGQAHYVLGFLTLAQDPNASRRHYEEAETHLREALRKNNNYRLARAYLVAVLSELGRQDEAESEMAILRDASRLQASQDLIRFQEYVQRVAPYEDSAITTRLGELWQAAGPHGTGGGF